MAKSKITLVLFAILAVLQVYIPAKMILEKEDVLSSGKEYKFKTAPVDPYDPFRGKYITLRFADNQVAVTSEENWIFDEVVYAEIFTDKDGFAKMKSVSKDIPKTELDYLKVKVNYYAGDSTGLLTINYPFDRFYMEESKAKIAEEAYIEINRDSTKNAYALVNVKNGEAVLKDVIVNGLSVNELNPKRN